MVHLFSLPLWEVGNVSQVQAPTLLYMRMGLGLPALAGRDPLEFRETAQPNLGKERLEER